MHLVEQLEYCQEMIDITLADEKLGEWQKTEHLRHISKLLKTTAQLLREKIKEHNRLCVLA